MSIKSEVLSPDLALQIRLMQASQTTLDRFFIVAMRRAVDLTYGLIKPNVPRKTGRAAGSLRKGVWGYGMRLMGTVGFYDGEVYYINVVEHGARKHSLVKRKGRGGSQKQRARREETLTRRIEKGLNNKYQAVMINGKWVSIAVHPGFSRRGFMASGYAAARPVVAAEMKKAADQALNAMAVK